jgi:hypothetical protein
MVSLLLFLLCVDIGSLKGIVKMKKISLLVACLVASGMASAIEFPASGQLQVGVCNLLNEDVNLSLTTGVVAGVSCNANRVAIATCHTAGMVKSRNVGTKTIQVDDGNGNMVDQEVSCSIGAADPACAGTTITGAGIANATTRRGTVTTSYPGTGACTSAAIPDAFATSLN